MDKGDHGLVLWVTGSIHLCDRMSWCLFLCLWVMAASCVSDFTLGVTARFLDIGSPCLWVLVALPCRGDRVVASLCLSLCLIYVAV